MRVPARRALAGPTAQASRPTEAQGSTVQQDSVSVVLPTSDSEVGSAGGVAGGFVRSPAMPPTVPEAGAGDEASDYLRSGVPMAAPGASADCDSRSAAPSMAGTSYGHAVRAYRAVANIQLWRPAGRVNGALNNDGGG